MKTDSTKSRTTLRKPFEIQHRPARTRSLAGRSPCFFTLSNFPGDDAAGNLASHAGVAASPSESHASLKPHASGSASDPVRSEAGLYRNGMAFGLSRGRCHVLIDCHEESTTLLMVIREGAFPGEASEDVSGPWSRSTPQIQNGSRGDTRDLPFRSRGVGSVPVPPAARNSLRHPWGVPRVPKARMHVDESGPRKWRLSAECVLDRGLPGSRGWGVPKPEWCEHRQVRSSEWRDG